MNIVVCVKHIPDPNLPAEIHDGRLRREGVQGVLDPGDEFGVEAAVRLKEEHGGEVTLVSMGPAPAVDAVKRGLSMGADRGLLVTDEALVGADALATARVLAAAIRRAEFDLVIAGVESTDGYTGTMPSSLAELLDLPQVTYARALVVSGDGLRAERQTADGYQVVECPLPALVSVTAGVNEPRYPSFKGIMAAKKKPVERLSLADLGAAAVVEVGQAVREVSAAAERKAGDVFHDDGSAAACIADILEKAKVI